MQLVFCAIEAGKRGRKVAVIDHAKRLGGKILMSGGGRCNFTTRMHHPKTSLARILIFANQHSVNIRNGTLLHWSMNTILPITKKTLGQLFCDETAKDIVDMLLSECAKANVKVINRTQFDSVTKHDGGYSVNTSNGSFM